MRYIILMKGSCLITINTCIILMVSFFSTPSAISATSIPATSSIENALTSKGDYRSYKLELATGVKVSERKNCYVWFESNNKKYFNLVLSSLPDWISVGQVIITGRKHNVVKFYKILRRRFGNRIITGFKTSDFFKEKSIYDFEAWREISILAKRLSVMSGGAPVVIDNEGLIKKLLKGKNTSVDLDKLSSAIKGGAYPLIWWWYGPEGRSSRVISLTEKFAIALKNGIPDMRFIEASSGGFVDSDMDYWSKSNLKKTILIEKKPVSIVYLDDSLRRFWKLQHINLAIKSVIGRDVIIYPGIMDIGEGKRVSEYLEYGTCLTP